jgi:hypothetical protein
MLNVAPWSRLPLKVLWLQHEQLRLLSECTSIPSHIQVQTGDIELLPKRKRKISTKKSNNNVDDDNDNDNDNDDDDVSGSVCDLENSDADDGSNLLSLPVECQICEDYIYDKQALVCCPAILSIDSNGGDDIICDSYSHIYCLADLLLRLEEVFICYYVQCHLS